MLTLPFELTDRPLLLHAAPLRARGATTTATAAEAIVQRADYFKRKENRKKIRSLAKSSIERLSKKREKTRMQPPSVLSRLERDLEHTSDETAAEAALRIGEHLARSEEVSFLLF